MRFLIVLVEGIGHSLFHVFSLSWKVTQRETERGERGREGVRERERERVRERERESEREREREGERV